MDVFLRCRGLLPALMEGHRRRRSGRQTHKVGCQVVQLLFAQVRCCGHDSIREGRFWICDLVFDPLPALAFERIAGEFGSYRAAPTMDLVDNSASFRLADLLTCLYPGDGKRYGMLLCCLR